MKAGGAAARSVLLCLQKQELNKSLVFINYSGPDLSLQEKMGQYTGNKRRGILTVHMWSK